MIEQPWQAWELAQADTDRYRSMSPQEVGTSPTSLGLDFQCTIESPSVELAKLA